jgi:hypothetical protein
MQRARGVIGYVGGKPVYAIQGGSGGAEVNFVVTPKGIAVPIPEGATGPVDIVNKSGRVTGFAFVGGSSGDNGQVDSVRVMNPTLPNSRSPGYPDGYVRYMNPSRQAVDLLTGRTLSDEISHYSLTPGSIWGK